jgi:hypothetical protein
MLRTENSPHSVFQNDSEYTIMCKFLPPCSFGIVRPNQQDVVFRCSFADADGQAYSYDVYWYINEQSVVAHKRIEYNNTDQSLLRPKS